MTEAEKGQQCQNQSGQTQRRRVSVYAIHSETVRRMDWGVLYARLPVRMEKTDRYRFERDRLLSAGAGILLLQVLGLREESELQCGEYGKLSAPGYPAFNLSHSGEWCVLATGEGELGVDIERMDAAHLRIAPKVYTPAELQWMNEHPLERFYRLWTWKESVMKATGQGMRLEPRGFEVLPFAKDEPILLNGQHWYACDGALEDCRYSVCAPYPLKTELIIYEEAKPIEIHRNDR